MYLKWGLLDLILRIINNKLVPSILMMTAPLLSGQHLGNFFWLESINSLFRLFIKHLFGLGERKKNKKRCRGKQRTLVFLASLIGSVTHSTSVCWWLLIQRSGDRDHAKIKAIIHTIYEGEKGKPILAKLKIHDCTCSSHMTTLTEEIIWNITVRWSWICPWKTSITHIFPFASCHVYDHALIRGHY